MPDFRPGQTRGFTLGTGTARLRDARYEGGNGNNSGPADTSKWSIIQPGSNGEVGVQYLGGETEGVQIQLTIRVGASRHVVHARIVD